MFRHHTVGEWKNPTFQSIEWAQDQQTPVQGIFIEGHRYSERSQVDAISTVVFGKPPTTTTLAAPKRDTGRPDKVASYAPSREWNLAGFWGMRGPENVGGFTQLGPIWGKIQSTMRERSDNLSLFEDGKTKATVTSPLLNALTPQSNLGRSFRLSQLCSTGFEGSHQFATYLFDYRYRSLNPSKIALTGKDAWVKAITITYHHDQIEEMGTVPVGHEPTTDAVTTIADRGDIREIEIHCSKDAVPKVGYIEIRRWANNALIPLVHCGDKLATSNSVQTLISRPTDLEGHSWWFAGFYGSAENDGITSLGVVWARQYI